MQVEEIGLRESVEIRGTTHLSAWPRRKLGRLNVGWVGFPKPFSADQAPAAAELALATTDLYPQVPALRIASIASAAVMSGVVWTFATAPPAANAMAIAAAETLSGISVMTITSNGPNAKYAVCNFPPSFSMGTRTISNRSCGSAISKAQASLV